MIKEIETGKVAFRVLLVLGTIMLGYLLECLLKEIMFN